MRLTWSIVLFSSALVLSGCTAAPFVTPTSTSTNSVPGVALHGMVHGGQSPIQNAHVYLYQVNETGYGAQATSLLTTGAGTDGYGTYVMTDMNGTWTLTGNYSCTTSAPVYVLAIGGGPSGTGTNNPYIGLASPLGSCDYAALISYTSIVVNEVSTVAAAYAFAAYSIDATHVGTGSSNLAATGLQNAFENFLNLEAFFGGTANTTTSGGNGAVPAAEINTLANILAACVNSASPFTNCSTLFSNAKNSGGVAPSETTTAAINIAHNPGANIANLFALQAAGGAPFVPDLNSAPNDFTVAITYTKGGLNSPQSVAIDASGNVWVANGANDTISEFSPTSGYTPASNSPFSGAAEPWGIAIDTSSPADVWVSNASGGTGGKTLGEFSSSGALINTFPDMTTMGASNLDFPRGVAIDNSSNIWIADSENATLTEYNPGMNAFSSYSGVGGLDFPSEVAVDISGNIWVSNGSGNGSGSISVFSSTGAVNSNDPITAGGISSPFGLAIDGSGNAWVSNSSGSITKLSLNGGSVTGTNFAPAIGLSGPKGLAIDGAGNIWVADSNSGAISEMSSSGAAISPANGYGYCTACNASMGLPFGVAIDGSGDVWMTGYSYGTLTEFVGAATPVVTPLAANLATSSAINKP